MKVLIIITNIEELIGITGGMMTLGFLSSDFSDRINPVSNKITNKNINLHLFLIFEDFIFIIKFSTIFLLKVKLKTF